MFVVGIQRYLFLNVYRNDVYVQVGDDGLVFLVIEDEVFQFLVSGLGNGFLFFDVDESGDGEDDEEDEEEDDE